MILLGEFQCLAIFPRDNQPHDSPKLGTGAATWTNRFGVVSHGSLVVSTNWFGKICSLNWDHVPKVPGWKYNMIETPPSHITNFLLEAKRKRRTFWWHVIDRTYTIPIGSMYVWYIYLHDPACTIKITWMYSKYTIHGFYGIGMKLGFHPVHCINRPTCVSCLSSIDEF